MSNIQWVGDYIFEMWEDNGRIKEAVQTRLSRGYVLVGVSNEAQKTVYIFARPRT